MLKQQLTGEVWAVGGKPEDIIPLHTALYNWQGIGFKNEPCEPLDLGAPDLFVYFLVRKANFIKARAKAMLNCINPLPHLSNKGKSCWGLAEVEAGKQFDALSNEEKFIHYGNLGMVMDIVEMEGDSDSQN